jgi:CubicO group peptidase (beta-lactamase class C family)
LHTALFGLLEIYDFYCYKTRDMEPGCDVSLSEKCVCTDSRRLQDTVSQIYRVKELCQVPSISFGVIHQGRVVLRESVGHRDVEQRLEADADTIYMLGSCSKMFASAAVGILVDEGKLQWFDPVQKYLPDFDPKGDSRIGKTADLVDLLRHSTGIAGPDTLCFGPQGLIVVDEDNLIPLLNTMPTADDKGQRFNRHWAYNNFTYGLVAKIVESVTGERYADFVKQHILQPLKMTRTALSRADIVDDQNVAAPYTKLDNGMFVRSPAHCWPCEDHSPLLSATGMRSSLNDMLTWCMAVLSAERRESQSQSQSQSQSHPYHRQRQPRSSNPLKEMQRVRRGYWTRPPHDPLTSNEAAYCMGWVRMILPSSMLGAFSANSMSRDETHQVHLKQVVGRDSNPRLAVGHNGGMVGSTITVWTFPETQSAVVAMANGRDFGDASDFTAQILIQELFQLNPRIDFIPWMKMEAALAKNSFTEKFLQPWKREKRDDDHERDRMIYVGEYQGFNGLFALTIFADQKQRDSDVKLFVRFNHHRASVRSLLFFQTDVYSFLPQDRDSWVSAYLPIRDHRQALLQFELDGVLEKATGVWWLWNVDEKPALLRRTTSS